MSYTAVPDMRMPYDNDGTVFVSSAAGQAYTSGATTYPNGTQLAAMNSAACLTSSTYGPLSAGANAYIAWWWFFPEQREVTAAFFGYQVALAAFGSGPVLQGSNDTTNGLDGTWETATTTALPNTTTAAAIDSWRSGIKSISFTGPKKVIRVYGQVSGSGGSSVIGTVMHLYGQKGAGQTPDDIIYLDGQNAYAAFTSVEDFGDVPLGTTTTRTFKVQNSSATKTANSINLQCNDADFAISSDGSTWVTTINIASLAAGASSGVLYVRNTTPSPGAALGPRFARIVCTVGSWV